jgi:hypothetical protein
MFSEKNDNESVIEKNAIIFQEAYTISSDILTPHRFTDINTPD